MTSIHQRNASIPSRQPIAKSSRVANIKTQNLNNPTGLGNNSGSFNFQQVAQFGTNVMSNPGTVITPEMKELLSYRTDFTKDNMYTPYQGIDVMTYTKGLNMSDCWAQLDDDSSIA